MMDPVIVIHGGAWAIPDSLVEASILGVQAAAKAGWSILSKKQGTALDAVEAAVKILEDDPAFDSGTGAVLTFDGQVELDAMIMEGKELKAGAVACVQNIKNPVQLARLVMERTEHILIVGQGANAFANECGVLTVEKEELVTAEAIKQWEQYRKYKSTVTSLFSERNGHDTVGCVAIDKDGNLACATSTGGITAKRSGRVGDSPIIGAGGYADNDSGAVSCTGHGESIAKVCLAKKVADECTAGRHPSEALSTSLNYMQKRVGGSGGAICIDKCGRFGFCFTTERMAWAVVSKVETTCGINPNERIQFKVE